MAFWQAAWTSSFAWNALLISLLASVVCGVVGTYVVTRRISYIAAAIAHSVLAGLGGARYLAEVHGFSFITPQMGALAAALVASGVIGWTALHASEREDTAIGAVWAFGMAAGVLLIHATPGYHEDLMSYLFGNILLVSRQELWLTGLLDVLVLVVVFFSYGKLQAVCFDEEFARVRNVHVDAYYFLLLALTAVTVVLLSMMVGIVMVIALLTLPAAIAGRFSGSLAQMMGLAAVLCALFNLTGLTLSYEPGLPPGAVIIMVGGLAYFVSVGAGARLRRSD